jgi:putative ABC transport system permease protein
LAPALQQREGALASTLRDEGRTSSGGLARQRGRRTLVITEIALSLVVAAGAALMVKSFLNARNADPGFNPDHLVTFRLALPDYRYRTSTDVHRAEVGVVDRIRNLPGVRDVSAATAMPMNGQWHIAVALDGVELALVFPGYFKTLQIPMRSGAAFTGRESDDSPPVAIVNESFAKKFYSNASPIGRRLKWGSASSPAPWATIVGVSADVRAVSLDTPVEPAIYLPAFQHDTGLITSVARSMAYVARTQGPPEGMFKVIRQVVREVDPGLPIINMRTEDDIASLSVSARRFNTALLTSFALLGLVLAAVGIYGLMAFAVVERTREIGIRLAIGATQRDVLAMVVGQGARLGVVGIVIGLAGVVAFTRVMRTLLFDVSPLDPVALIGTAALVLAIAATASYLPARRASKIDPQSAIRND